MDYLFYSPESKLYGLTIFVTVVVFQMAFITWQWFYERRNDYLYYLAYMFLTVCYGLSEFEEFLPFKVFTHLTENFKYYSTHFLPSMSIFLYYRFARAFLNLPATRPKLNVYVSRLEIFIIILAVISLILSLSGVSWIIQEYIYLTGTSIVIISSGLIIANFLRNSTPLSRFAMLGAGCLLTGSAISFILLILEDRGYQLMLDPYLPLLLFVIAEILVFSTGLIFKSRMIEKQKFEAEQALLREFKHRQSLELQMFKVREDISRDLHDEIGSGLSKITLLGEVIRSSTTKPEPRIDKIIDAAKDMMEGMSEMVWSLNSQNDILSDFIYYLRRYTTEYFEDSGMQLEIAIMGDIPNKSMSGLQRKNVLMVFKEILNNILKHSKARLVHVKFEYKNGSLWISVHDDGVGIPSSELRHKGNGVFNMQSRMKEINGNCVISNNNGTNIQIELEINDSVK